MNFCPVFIVSDWAYAMFISVVIFLTLDSCEEEVIDKTYIDVANFVPGKSPQAFDFSKIWFAYMLNICNHKIKKK